MRKIILAILMLLFFLLALLQNLRPSPCLVVPGAPFVITAGVLKGPGEEQPIQCKKIKQSAAAGCEKVCGKE